MRIIDISHTLSSDTPPFPSDEPTILSRYREIDRDGYTGYFLETSLHTGTHIDTPMHIFKDARSAADFSPERFIGRGVLLDVRGEKNIVLKRAYEKAICPGDIVLLYTGWDEHYGHHEYFKNHPVINTAFSDFLCETGIKMLGMDSPSPDHHPFGAHKQLLSRDIFLLENCTNLGALLSEQHFKVIALPLKIQAEASPVRAVCCIEE